MLLRGPSPCTGHLEPVLCGLVPLVSQFGSSGAVPRTQGQVRLLSSLLPVVGFSGPSMALPLPDSPVWICRLPLPQFLATCEARTLWPGSQGPRPQFQVETVLFLGTCQWLPALPEHPGPRPRTVAKKGSTALSDSLLSPLENPSACCFLVPAWGHKWTPFQLPQAPGPAAGLTAFGAQLWPPPFLSALSVVRMGASHFVGVHREALWMTSRVV